MLQITVPTDRALIHVLQTLLRTNNILLNPQGQSCEVWMFKNQSEHSAFKHAKNLLYLGLSIPTLRTRILRKMIYDRILPSTYNTINKADTVTTIVALIICSIMSTNSEYRFAHPVPSAQCLVQRWQQRAEKAHKWRINVDMGYFDYDLECKTQPIFFLSRPQLTTTLRRQHCLRWFYRYLDRSPTTLAPQLWLYRDRKAPNSLQDVGHH
jgi:hypothetical protein